MKNTDLFFIRAKEFQGKRAGLVDAYEKKMQALEDTKGSRFFDDESKKAEEIKEEALKALKDEYNGYFRASLEAMSKANESRQMIPPTEEELRVLQMLKLKDKPTEAEFAAAANTLKGNPTCLSILTEMSHKAGYMRGYHSEAKEMPVDVADETIKGLHSSLRDFMDYDTTKAARLARAHKDNFYGVAPDAPALPKRRLFETKEECFDIVANISGDYLAAFCSAVDGE